MSAILVFIGVVVAMVIIIYIDKNRLKSAGLQSPWKRVISPTLFQKNVCAMLIYLQNMRSIKWY